MKAEDIRREIERRLEQYRMGSGAEGAKWLDDAISIVNDVFDPLCPPRAEAHGYAPGTAPEAPESEFWRDWRRKNTDA